MRLLLNQENKIFLMNLLDFQLLQILSFNNERKHTLLLHFLQVMFEAAVALSIKRKTTAADVSLLYHFTLKKLMREDPFLWSLQLFSLKERASCHLYCNRSFKNPIYPFLSLKYMSSVRILCVIAESGWEEVSKLLLRELHKKMSHFLFDFTNESIKS